MNDAELLRYSRQIMLPEFDVAGQERLLRSHALLLGCGGLGSSAGIYLTASGIGAITLVDFDRVSVSNLQRQIAHGESDVGRPKVESAAEALSRLNSGTCITPVNRQLHGDELNEQVRRADLVLDATDNFRARYEINEMCVRLQKPLVSAAAIRMEGHVSVFDVRNDSSPCYRCLYEDSGESELNCSENGVISPLVGIVGSIQAMEAVKVLAEFGSSLTGYVLFIDAKRMEARKLRLSRNPECPTCNAYR